MCGDDTYLDMNRLFALSAKAILRFKTADRMITPIALRYDNSWPSN